MVLCKSLRRKKNSWDCTLITKINLIYTILVSLVFVSLIIENRPSCTNTWTSIPFVCINWSLIFCSFLFFSFGHATLSCKMTSQPRAVSILHPLKFHLVWNGLIYHFIFSLLFFQPNSILRPKKAIQLIYLNYRLTNRHSKFRNFRL